MNIDVNDITLFYETAGAGEPLILLHGNGEDHHIFDPLSEKLKAQFTLYAIDSRNQGQSSKTDDYSYETMAEDVHAFVEALALQPANIIGFSDGAIISLLIAQKYPTDVARMALLGVNLKPEDLTPAAMEYIKAYYEKTDDPLFKLMLEQPQIELESLKTIQTPTLLIGAEHDIIRQDVFAQILAALPNAKLKIMEGQDHESYIVGQDLLAPDFLEFFGNKKAQ